MFDKTKKLSNANYNQWARQTKLLLQKECLWSIVDGRKKAPNSANAEKLLEWEDKRDQALATILLEMNPKIQNQYISATDPAELWERLETDLKDKSVAHPEEQQQQRGHKEREQHVTPLPPNSENPHLSFEIDEETHAALGPNDWVTNTGSNSHFTGRREAFSSYVQFPEKKTFGSNVEAMGYGEVVLRITGQRKPVRFSAFYVPTLAVNLLSLESLADSYDTDEKGMTLKKADGSTIAVAQIVGDVPVLRGEPFKKKGRKQPRKDKEPKQAKSAGGEGSGGGGAGW